MEYLQVAVTTGFIPAVLTFFLVREYSKNRRDAVTLITAVALIFLFASLFGAWGAFEYLEYTEGQARELNEVFRRAYIEKPYWDLGPVLQ